MESTQFEQELIRDGFTPAVAGDYPPLQVNHDHTHPFEVRGLVVKGQMRISSATHSQLYGPGDVFVMKLGDTHREEVGAEGCRYLYGSRER